MLREFLYLDDSQVTQYLEQIDEGVSDEHKEKITRDRRRNRRLGLKKGPAEASIGSDRGESEDRERTVSQTPPSRFNRLYKELERTDQLVLGDAMDDELWDQLSVREILEFSCEIEVPQMARALAQADSLSSLMPFFEQANGQADDKAREALEGFAMLGKAANGKVAAIGHAGDDQWRLSLPLKSEYLRVDVEDLEAEVVVLCKIREKWPESEKRALLTLPGLGIMNRQQRRAYIENNGANLPDDMWVAGPAADVTVIGIYR